MAVIELILLVLGALSFFAALIGVGEKVNWVALGLLFWIITAIIQLAETVNIH